MGSFRVDGAGAVCSAACAAHCASVSVFPSIVAAVGLGVLPGSTVEWGLTMLAMAFAGLALATGWRRHRASIVAIAFALGFVGLVGGRVLEELELDGEGTGVGVGAALCLIAGHVLNIRLVQRQATGA